MIAPVVYMLGTLVTLACGILLLRGYARGKSRLLLWSGLCFCGLSASNLMVFIDLVLLPEIDLYIWRLFFAAIAMMLLLYGLIWEGD